MGCWKKVTFPLEKGGMDMVHAGEATRGHRWGVGRGGVGVSGAAGVSGGEAALGRVEVSAKMGCGFIAAQVAWPGRSRRGPRRRRMAVLAACRT